MIFFFLSFIFASFTPDNGVENYLKGDYQNAFSIFSSLYDYSTIPINSTYGYFYALSSCDTSLSKQVFEGIVSMYPRHLYRKEAYRELIGYYIATGKDFEAMKLLIDYLKEYPGDTQSWINPWRFYLSERLKLSDTLALKDNISGNPYFSVYKQKKEILNKHVKSNYSRVEEKKINSVNKHNTVSRYFYTIQVAALSSYSRANKLKKHLVKKYNKEVIIEKVGSLYKVKIGKFSSRNDARKFLKKVKKEYKDAYIKKGS